MREASDGDELGTAGNASARASPSLRCDSEQQQQAHSWAEAVVSGFDDIHISLSQHSLALGGPGATSDSI